MTPEKVAQVAVEGVAYHFDKPYDYLVPAQLAGEAKRGARVAVPFGRGDRLRAGVILTLTEGSGDGLKPIARLFDSEPLIDPTMIGLALWLKTQTFCTQYEALRLMLPAGLSMRVKRVWSLCPDAAEAAAGRMRDDEREVVGLLAKGPLEEGRLLALAGLGSDASLPEKMARRGLLTLREGAGESAHGAFERVVRALPAAGETEGKPLTPKQKSVLAAVLAAGETTEKEIAYATGVGPSVIKTLVRRGLLETAERRVERRPAVSLTREKGPTPALSDTQESAYEKLLEAYRSGKGSASLLFGVTGSGKTQVFMKLIARVRADGRAAIVLVPEIALTPQAVERFYARFGDDVAVLHSGLTQGERMDEWRRIRDGKARVVVGTRSAVFAPVRSLGLIVIDEEQEHTYKSESSPRYHARDVARYRCAKENALLVLSSATPDIGTYYAAQSGRYGLSRLDGRFGSAVLPKVIAVDMRRELEEGNDGAVSRLLARQLAQTLERREQAILLLNRRGYNTFAHCGRCGYVLTCPNCSIALTFHSANGRVMCHYCGYSAPAPEICPACGGGRLRYSGCGTQRAEEELARLLPGARILRMDTDTTSARMSHEKLLGRFAKGEYDILVGTQMVAKGLDFPAVTLVGVLSADQTLFMDDFRASERTFALLTQVVGRSGRGALAGRAVIQTFSPDSEVIRLAERQDYEAFYRSEIALRKTLLYPPFCDLCEIGFSAVSPNKAGLAAGDFCKRLAAAAPEGMPLRVMGPSEASVFKVGGRYRYKIIVKCRNEKNFRNMMSGLLREFGKIREYGGVAVFADLNPLSTL